MVKGALNFMVDGRLRGYRGETVEEYMEIGRTDSWSISSGACTRFWRGGI